MTPFENTSFFGVLFPGLASVIFLYLLLPSNIQISLPEGIIFVLVFAFLFGQALQSVALSLEILPETFLKFWNISWSHRQEFREQLNNPTYVPNETIKNIRRGLSNQFPGFEEKMAFRMICILLRRLKISIQRSGAICIQKDSRGQVISRRCTDFAEICVSYYMD